MAERRQLPPQIKRIELARRAGGRPVVRYQLTVDVGVVDGKRKQLRKRYPTEAEARDALAEIQGNVAKGTYVHPTELSVEQACADWLASRKGRLDETTWGGYEWILRPVRSELGELPVQKLERRTVNDLVNRLREGGTTSQTTRTRADGTTKTTVRTRKPWGPRSINYMLQTLGMVLDQLVEDGKVTRNVAASVDRIPGDPSKAKKLKKHDTYTATEVEQILEAVRDDRLQHVWHLVLSGPRRGEIGGLDWNEDISLIPGDEHISFGRRTRVSAQGRAIEKMGGKSDEAQRNLPLWEPMTSVLKAAKARQAAEKLRAGEAYHDLGYVVCNEIGQPYHPDTLSKMWKKVTAKAGVRHIRLHDGRHTSATLLLMQGLDPATVSGWLGHADVAFTMRTYVHPQREAMAKGAGIMGQIMGAKAGS